MFLIGKILTRNQILKNLNVKQATYQCLKIEPEANILKICLYFFDINTFKKVPWSTVLAGIQSFENGKGSLHS